MVCSLSGSWVGWVGWSDGFRRCGGGAAASVGMMMAAAVVCVRISTSLDPLEAWTKRSGTIDSAVSTTVVRTKVERGRCARRENIRARAIPIRAPTRTSWAKPATGICLPPTATATPAAWATRTVAEVATAAIPPEIRPGTSSRGRVGEAWGTSSWFGASVVVAVIGNPFQVRSPGGDLQLPLRTQPTESTSIRREFSSGRAGPLRSSGRGRARRSSVWRLLDGTAGEGARS